MAWYLWLVTGLIVGILSGWFMLAMFVISKAKVQFPTKHTTATSESQIPLPRAIHHNEQSQA